MSQINEKTIGEIVASDYRTASIFKSYGIDFCCKGNRTISEVCDEKGISKGILEKKLEHATQQKQSGGPRFTSWSLNLLAFYIENKHHLYVRAKIPEIKYYLENLCEVHGPNHPELFEVKELFSSSVDELSSHMRKEEKVLFPLIRAMAEAEIIGNQNLQHAHFGTVQRPITMMIQEHDNEGERFHVIADLTNNYTPPADACNTYQVAFAVLREFEDDLHKHIHLENNILFPKAIELEKKLSHA